MDRPDTTALLRRAREGERQAFDALYERVAAKLLAIIRLRLGRSLRSQLESRDILQATLLKSFEHFDQFARSDTPSLVSWLARIAENEIRDRVDYHQRQRRDARAEVPLEGGHLELVAHARSVLSQIVFDERAEMMEQALESLDEHYRQVIVMRAFEELSFPEIGKRLDKSEDACRMLFARAMAALTMRMTGNAARS